MYACFSGCFLGQRSHQRQHQTPAEPPAGSSTRAQQPLVRTLSGKRVDVLTNTFTLPGDGGSELQCDDLVRSTTEMHVSCNVPPTSLVASSGLAPSRKSARMFDGPPIDVDFVGVGVVKSARLRIAQALHEPSRKLMLVSMKGEELQDTDPFEGEIGVIILDDEHSTEIQFSNALTGDPFDVAHFQLDLTLPIAVIRSFFASFLNADEVFLIDEEGNVLKDDDVLFELRVSHVKVAISNERMTMEKLRGPEPRYPNSSCHRCRRFMKGELDIVLAMEFRVEVPDAFLDEGLLRVFLPGPKGTIYEDSDYELLMKFPDDYPLNPPEAWFVTEIEHWSVTPAGKVLVDMLTDRWSPALSTDKIVHGIASLLADPAP